ncbi:hypothetical protein [Sphingomonas hylomeconis]|uniref:Uncharacterized protein n=1 Tax=Sphingomonas hylomeconis TaxID=1395958 RepID=A0ABV7SRF5_9SPHN|nr:hypothetical protein [Sphingomonas hylomeconis]
MADLKEDGSTLGGLIRNKWFQAASALGVILGIIGFVIGLPPVADMAFGKRVSLTLEVVNQIPVFTVRQPVPGLSVQLNSQDLTQTRRDLVAVRLRLRNNGEVSINARNTTPRDPLGFYVRGGQIVRLYELGATSEHLRKLAIPKKIGNSFILPPGIIFDPGDFVQFNLLIVRPVNKGLSFSTVGKVEGLKSIDVGRSDIAKQESNAASVAWTGGFVPQMLRTITYPFIAVAIIAAVIFIWVSVTDLIIRRKRNRREIFATKVAARWDHSDPKLRKLIPAMYAALGLHRLADLADKEAEMRRMEAREARLQVYTQKSEPLSDFEAGDAIEKTFGDEDVSIHTAKVLLEKLSLRDDMSGKYDDEFLSAVEKYRDILLDSYSRNQLQKADPKFEDHEYGIYFA